MDSYDWHEAGLTVGQVAERSGARPSALRFYERQGLISTDRTAGNQRRYRGDVLCRVAMIRVCQQAGLSLAQIRAALADAVPDGQVPGPQHWERLAHHLRRELRTRIHDLNHLLGELGSDATLPAAPALKASRPKLRSPLQSASDDGQRGSAELACHLVDVFTGAAHRDSKRSRELRSFG